MQPPPRLNRYSAPHASSSPHLRHPRLRQAPDRRRYARRPGRSPRQWQSDLYERLVTKAHLEQKLGALALTLGNELEKVRAELKNDIERVKAELKHEPDQHKAANKQALKELELTLKHELETHKTELKRDIREMEQKLTIKLGAFLVIGVTVLSVLDKLF